MSINVTGINGTIIPESFNSLGYTITNSKLSCVSGMFQVHMVFAYLVGIGGLLAIVSRVVKFLRPYHAWIGDAFVFNMLWCTASSLLIFRDGLPFPIIAFFTVMLITLTVAFFVIKIHQRRFHAKVLAHMDTASSVGKNSQQLYQEGIMAVAAGTHRTCTQRFFSLRMLHGILMTISWWSVSGRIFFADPVQHYECNVYPVFKVPGWDPASGVPLNFVPDVDPTGGLGNFPGGEVGFVLLILLPVVAIIIGFAISVSAYQAHKSKDLPVLGDAKPLKEAPSGNHDMVTEL